MAVSQESWITPMMKPMPTTCIAISAGMPKREQAIGISSRDPPATPDAPQAETVARRLRMTAEGMSTGMPSVEVVARVNTVMVMAAPFILMVAPKGMETEYRSRSSPRSSHSSMFTGMLAAELLVKKAVIPLSFRHLSTSG